MTYSHESIPTNSSCADEQTIGCSRYLYIDGYLGLEGGVPSPGQAHSAVYEADLIGIGIGGDAL